MDEEETFYSIRQIHDELDGKPSEWISGNSCPYCGAEGEDLEEAPVCTVCGCARWPEDMVTKHICKECWGKPLLEYLEDMGTDFDEFVVEMEGMKKS